MRMTIKQNILIIASSLVIAGLIPFIYKRHNGESIVSKTFHSGSGWGYDILLNGKLIIHQAWVPAVSEKKEFSTETEAKETAALVISKIKNNKFPTLSKAEVEQICEDKKLHNMQLGMHE